MEEPAKKKACTASPARINTKRPAGEPVCQRHLPPTGLRRGLCASRPIVQSAVALLLRVCPSTARVRCSRIWTMD